MSRRFNIQRCRICGVNEFEDNMLEYNDKWFCGITCKLKQERKEDESLNQNDPGSDSTVVPYRPIICGER